jgi:hypothetical protein
MNIMGLWITLRMDKERSFFRQNLLQMISNQRELDGDCLVLASGYFWEEIEPKTSEKYSISIDRLVEAIKDNERITEVQVIGAMGSPARFNTFCDNLETEWRPVIRREVKAKNWHAKVAMKLHSDPANGEKIPVCAIIGSSNLTRPSYGIRDDVPENVRSSFGKFNHECDVLIFSNAGFSNNQAETKSPVFPGFDGQAIGSIYFSELPKDCPDEIEQMKRLWHDIDEFAVKVERTK